MRDILNTEIGKSIFIPLFFLFISALFEYISRFIKGIGSGGTSYKVEIIKRDKNNVLIKEIRRPLSLEEIPNLISEKEVSSIEKLSNLNFLENDSFYFDLLLNSFAIDIAAFINHREYTSIVMFIHTVLLIFSIFLLLIKNNESTIEKSNNINYLLLILGVIGLLLSSVII